MSDDDEIPNLIRRARRIAVVGMKDEAKADAPGYEVPRRLMQLGYEITPVNPNVRESLGRTAYPDLASVPDVPDIVNVFRRIEAIPALGREILALPAARRPAAVWMQTGIAHEPTARALRAEGILVVQDQCLGVMASLLGGPG